MTNYDNYVNLLLKPNLIPEIDKELATRSLQEFIKQAWIILQPVTPFVPGWHIDALCEHLEAISHGQIRNLVINIPPRHMKSLAVSIFCAAGLSLLLAAGDQEDRIIGLYYGPVPVYRANLLLVACCSQQGTRLTRVASARKA
jgi:hypothetical protein